MSTSIFKLLTSLIQKQDSPTTPELPSSFQQFTIVANEENVEVSFDSRQCGILPPDFGEGGVLSDEFTEQMWNGCYSTVGLSYTEDREALRVIAENNYSFFEYRYDVNDQWTPYTINEILILPTINSYVQIRMNPKTFLVGYFNWFKYSSGWYISTDNGLCKFNISKSVSLHGKLASLLSIEKIDTVFQNYLFDNIFGSTLVTDVSNLILPLATGDGCFRNMFYNCSNLILPPKQINLIPTSACEGSRTEFNLSQALAEVCQQMFYNCSSLTEIPKITGANLGTGALGLMFYGCSSLSIINMDDIDVSFYLGQISEDSQHTQMYYPCDQMFYGCTNLQYVNGSFTASALPSYCCYYMFAECTQLISGPQLPATTIYGEAYMGMFYNCSSLKVVPELPATTVAANAYCQMFQYCTSIQSTPETFYGQTLGEGACAGMFSDCTNLRTTYKVLPATILPRYCYGDMYAGCTSLTVSPKILGYSQVNDLSFETDSSCPNMFGGCTSLHTIKADLASWCGWEWVNGVAETGTFITVIGGCLETSIQYGISYIPEGWTVQIIEPIEFQAL